MKESLFYFTLFASLLFISCGTDSNGTNETDLEPDEPVINAFPNLTFNQPVLITHAGDGSDRLFVAEKAGVIRVFPNDRDTEQDSLFLDISARVDDAGNEKGLLGLAFHPEFETNGYFYVNYTAEGLNRTFISRFQVSQSDPNRASTGSEQVLLSYEQPFPNHNGGHLAFGPDGYLYIAAGDGGGAGDPEENGQDRTTLPGSILRIDVDSEQGGNLYAVPESNPFVGNDEGYREEIFAYGFRNPWRFSFDSETGDLWVADVGQNSLEEINIVENGGNYGWNILEGTECFEPQENCNREGLINPIFEYPHENQNRSVTGGFVYRGDRFPQLTGLYIYADFVSGRIWALDNSGTGEPVNTELYDADYNISSFGTDQNNELYICSFDGTIYRFGSGIRDLLP